MKKWMIFSLMLAVFLSASGCRQAKIKEEPIIGQNAVFSSDTAAAGEMTAPTVPEDGNPNDVTCKGTYTTESVTEAVAAATGHVELTNAQLQPWYWAAVAQYRVSGNSVQPDYSQPLDTQICEADSSVNSWQQYFLRQAVDNWHTAAALTQQAAQMPLETEEAYQPNLKTHATCMTDMPVTEILYGYNEVYQVNSMHQSYLDAMEDILAGLARKGGYADTAHLAQAAFGCTQEELTEFAWQYNYGYMYQTFLNYDLEFTEQELQAWYLQNRETLDVSEDDFCVDIRQIFLNPNGDWENGEKQAKEVLRQWQKKIRRTEATFGEVAYKNSQDMGSAANGGEYNRLLPGQLPEEVDAWCFDSARQYGDTATIRSKQGIHIVYFAGRTPLWQVMAEKALTLHTQEEQLRTAREAYPLDVKYDAICLVEADGVVSYGDVLYPDIAHERYPEVPLYLQQDYPKTWFGAYKISSHGCGITTFSMLATYMSDEEWTPPELCDLYGVYCQATGTDGMLFINEASNYNCYFRERAHDHRDAKKAMEAGYIVVCVQHKGYWTRAAHYLLFEKMFEDGTVQVRDSNIANYARIPAHAEDKHTWFDCVENAHGYWIYEKKVTNMQACSRCGSPDGLDQKLLSAEYLCRKCDKALQRRNAWLTDATA